MTGPLFHGQRGTLRYVRCASCGAHRVDLQAVGDAAPTVLSRAFEVP